MPKPAWLVTFLEEQDTLKEGREWLFSTDAPRKRATGDVRRRADGEPYTPQWRAGEDVFIYHPGSGRVVAQLTLDGPSAWDEGDGLFYTNSTVQVHNPDGPTLADIGVAKAVQGGRQRLTPSQHGAAVRQLRRGGRRSRQ